VKEGVWVGRWGGQRGGERAGKKKLSRKTKATTKVVPFDYYHSFRHRFGVSDGKIVPVREKGRADVPGWRRPPWDPRCLRRVRRLPTRRTRAAAPTRTPRRRRTRARRRRRRVWAWPFFDSRDETKRRRATRAWREAGGGGSGGVRRQESVREARRPGEGEVGSAWRTALPGCAKGSVAIRKHIRFLRPRK
jgi:hypothetical protein